MSLRLYINIVKVFAALSFVYWIILYFILPDSGALPFDIFGVLFTLTALLGAVVGFLIRKEWGGFGSTVGKSITFVSLSLLMWFFGQVAFLASYFLTGDVPYPGVPDLFFVLLDPFYAVALLLMVKYSGATSNLNSGKSVGKFLLLIIPLVCIYISYRIFIGDLSILQSMDASIVFDLIYTMGSILIISLTVLVFLLSITKLGGKMKVALYVMFLGFILQYVGDVVYTLRESEELFYNGGIADFIYFLSVVAITIGLARMNTERLGVPNGKGTDGNDEI